MKGNSSKNCWIHWSI